MAFESGTSSNVSQTSGVGVGMSGGNVGVGVGGATTHSVSMTAIAQKVAPPQQQKVGCGLWVAGILLLPILPYAIWKAMQASKWNKEEYPKLYAKWENSWICHKCGNTFVL